jgi:CheY-like chemotaxis protein
VSASGILIVEDNPPEARLIVDLLTSRQPDCAVVVAASGEEALSILESMSEPPRLVLLDLGLPGIDGAEVLAAIKGDSRLSSVPVVVFSGSDHPRDIALAYELRANAYVVKPDDLAGYESVVEAITGFWLTTAEYSRNLTDWRA